MHILLGRNGLLAHRSGVLRLLREPLPCPRVGVLYGVINQIDYHLLQSRPIPIAFHLNRTIGFDSQGEILLFCREPDLSHRSKCDRFALAPPAARFSFLIAAAGTFDQRPESRRREPG